MSWTGLESGAVLGTSPGPRYAIGSCSVLNKVYIFGGFATWTTGPGGTGGQAKMNCEGILTSISFKSVHRLNLESAVIYSGALNDLYELDPAKMSWTNLTAVQSHEAPTPRGYPGFAAAGLRIYLFGGVDDQSSEPSCARPWTKKFHHEPTTTHSRTGDQAVTHKIAGPPNTENKVWPAVSDGVLVGPNPQQPQALSVSRAAVPRAAHSGSPPRKVLGADAHRSPRGPLRLRSYNRSVAQSHVPRPRRRGAGGALRPWLCCGGGSALRVWWCRLLWK